MFNMGIAGAILLVFTLYEVHHVLQCGAALRHWMTDGQLLVNGAASRDQQYRVRWRWSFGPFHPGGVDGAYEFTVRLDEPDHHDAVAQCRVGWYEQDNQMRFRLISAVRASDGKSIAPNELSDLKANELK
jgi:hypothetical protein